MPKERAKGESRVALVPALVSRYTQLGASVVVESGAGKAAGFPDGGYADAQITRGSALSDADVVLTVRGLDAEQAAQLKPGAAVVGLLAAHADDFPADAYSKAGACAFALEKLPRISRAQSMDALSSQAAAAGYRAALIAATEAPRFFPMLTTAAGTVRPARVLVIGAGVAGLQAIATAHRLGAVVEGYDVRPAARTEVESLGARFVDTGVGAEGEGGYARELTDEEKQQQADKLAEHIARANVVITTAAVPGKAAPKIISKAMVEAMEAGSVIVDLAAASGGNCELTKPDKKTISKGVTILGPTNPAAGLAAHASEMYAKNVFNFVTPWFAEEGKMNIPADDEVYITTLVAGELQNVPDDDR
ncbi:MAG: NAD(P) transhydrogenase subunit alpha [Gammaproteobacteria bacterium]|nr:NAD(P) transhydrogenase subunit alpha [Gammaproteobacteria bacterium]